MTSSTRYRLLVSILLLALLSIPGHTLALHAEPTEPFLPGEPEEPPTQVMYAKHPLVQATMSSLFVEGGVNEINRSIERLHSFNVTQAHSVLRVNGMVVVEPGELGDYNVSLLQEGDLVASCVWRLQRGANVLGTATEGVNLDCGLGDPTPGQAPSQEPLKSGNVTIRFEHTGDLSDSNSHLNVHLLLWDEVEPEMHDIVADSTLGIYSMGEVLWVLAWLGVAIFALARWHLFLSALGWIGALGGALAPVMDAPFIQPETGVWLVFLAIVVVLFAGFRFVGDEWDRQKAESDDGGAA